MKKYLKQFAGTVVVLLVVFAGVLLAGSVDTTDAPVPTFYTLTDIYEKMTDPEYSYAEHSLSPTATIDEETMYSLDNIYDNAPAFRAIDTSTTTQLAGIYATTTLSDVETNLIPENIASGTVIFDVTGTFECE